MQVRTPTTRSARALMMTLESTLAHLSLRRALALRPPLIWRYGGMVHAMVREGLRGMIEGSYLVRMIRHRAAHLDAHALHFLLEGLDERQLALLLLPLRGELVLKRRKQK
eukprot:296252-Pyramimonas_sp.AAC.1